jgi:small subunit ribosomal protein S2
MVRNGIHIIDLKKTQSLLEDACNAITRIVGEGKHVLFVGTKKQAQDIIRSEAERCSMNYVTERWLGGMLTNFTTVRRSVRRLQEIEKMEADGTFEGRVKKERLMLSREKEKLLRVLGGVADMTRLPGAVFVVDVKKEHLAVNEAKILGIPIFAITDTNVDPDPIDFPIPANDDSIRTIQIITKAVTDAIAEGVEINKAHSNEAQAAPESDAKAETPRARGRRRAQGPRGDSHQ